ncbi:rna-directed dna polymerase from mobile element jockey-like [Pitangus sulphuratus]|nr:rna-directed dna polymerase from mobile element jockey-like [Pitangus sulphuratus]
MVPSDRKRDNGHKFLDFFKYMTNKRKTKGPLLNEVGTLITADTEKTMFLNAFFASVFTENTSPWGSLMQETRIKEWWKEYFPMVKMNGVSEHLGKLDIHGYASMSAENADRHHS